MAISPTMTGIVRDRADRRCEYCRLSESHFRMPHVVDHVIARQHGGPTELGNLALACGLCNLSKGPNIAGLDPIDGKLTRLFDPRSDRWADHFAYAGPIFQG